MSKTIYTRKGESIIVDDEDYGTLSRFRWNLAGVGYPSRRIRIPNTPPGKYRSEYMHRSLMGLTHGDKRLVDHINGIKLDNRKENLRTCSRSENMWNRGKPRQNTSGLKGVSWIERDQSWTAHIGSNNTQISLGYFRSKEEAYAAYREAAARLHGEFVKVA